MSTLAHEVSNGIYTKKNFKCIRLTLAHEVTNENIQQIIKMVRASESIDGNLTNKSHSCPKLSIFLKNP